MNFFTVSEQIAAIGLPESSCAPLELGAVSASRAAAVAAPGGSSPISGVGGAADVSPADGITQGRMTLPVGVDYLDGTFPCHLRPVVVEILTKYLGEGQERDRGTPGGHYGRSMRWESGALLGWDEGRPEAWMSLNGMSCALVPVECWRSLLGELEDRVGLRCSRLDLRVDLPRDVLPMQAVHDAAAAGNVVRYKRYNCVRPVKDIKTHRLEGDMATFGARGRNGGGCYVRVYDKFLESGGEVDATRLEAEFRSKRAQVNFEALASSLSDDSLVRKIGQMIGGSIDFRVRGQHAHIVRMPRVSWWESIVGMLGSVRLVVHRVVVPLQATLEYFRDNWTRTIGLAIDCIDATGHDGEAVMMGMLKEGRLRAQGWRQGARDLGLDVGRLLGIKLGVSS